MGTTVDGIKGVAGFLVDAPSSVAATLLAPVLRKALAEELEILNRLGSDDPDGGHGSPVRSFSQSGVNASRAARQKAEELGVDATSLEGSGVNGMVTARGDVLAAQS